MRRRRTTGVSPIALNTESAAEVNDMSRAYHGRRGFRDLPMDRRTFLTCTGAAAIAATVSDAFAQQPSPAKARFRTGLVAYSYRQALESKTMTYEDLIRIAVETGTDGIDLTVYWLPDTSDDYLLPLRRLAYRNRVEIYGIGTRVRLAQPPPALREQEVAEPRQRPDVAQRVGAAHVPA